MVKNNSLPPASQPWVRELEKRIKNLERETTATHSRVNHLKNVTSSPKMNLDSLTVGELKVGGDPVVIPFLTGAGLMGWSVSGGTVVGNRISSTGGPITVSATMPDLNIEGGFVMEWALEASATVDSIRVTNSIDPLVEDAEPNDAMANEVSTYYASAGYNLGDIEGYEPEPGEDVRPPVPVMVSFTFTNPEPGPFTVEIISSKASYTLPGQGGIQVTAEGDVLIVDSDGDSHPLRELTEAEAQAIIETAENLEQAQQDLEDARTEAEQNFGILDDKLGQAFPGDNIFDVDLAIEQAKQLAQQQFNDSITGTVVEYSRNSNETNPPVTGWSTTPPTRDPGTFIWMRTTISYGSGDTTTTEPVLLSGNDGLPGAPGVGITNTAISYARSTSGASAPASGWQEQPPSPIKGQFLWTRTIWTYSDGNTETGYSSAYWATDGADGEDGLAGKHGTKLTGTVNHYAQSASGTTEPTSGWATQPPEPVPGMYMWTRSTWSYDDGTTEQGYTVGKIGDTGDQGVSVTSITPHFRRLADSEAKPAKPTGMTPSGWVEVEPDYARDTTMWRSDRIVFSNGQISWTDVSKSSSYEAAKAAESAALDYADQMKQEAIDAGAHDLANLEIGGRNLYQQAGGEYLTLWNTQYDPEIVVEDGRRALAYSSSDDIIYTGRRGAPVIGVGETVTFSFWAKGSRPMTLPRVYLGAGAGNIVYPRDTLVTEEWKKFSVTHTVTAALTLAVHMYPTIRNSDGTYATFYITDMKLERGSKATDWTPAPEDVDAGIADARAIANTADGKALSAINMANGKNAATYTDVADGVAEPGPTPSTTIGEGRPEYDMHRNRRSNGQIIGEWIWTGTAWTRLTLSDAMLSSLDVGKLSAGTADIETAVIDKLWGQLGVFDKLDVRQEAYVSGINLKDGAVTSRTLNVVPETGTGGMELKPPGIRIIPDDAEGGTAVSLRVDEENMLTFAKGGDTTFSVNGDGNMVVQKLDVNSSLRYNDVELQDIFDSMPKGIVTIARANTYANAGTSQARVVASTFRTPATHRMYRISFTARITSTQPKRGIYHLRQSTGNSVNALNSSKQTWYSATQHNEHITFTGVYATGDDLGWPLNETITLGVFAASTVSGETIQYHSDGPPELVVEDLGPQREVESHTPYVPASGGGSGGGGTEDQPAPREYVQTFSPTWHQSYLSGGGQNGSGANRMYHGQPGSGGVLKSMIGFSTAVQTFIGSGTVTKVEVYLKNTHTWSSSGMTAAIGWHSSGSKTTSYAQTWTHASTYGTRTSFNRGQGRWVTMPIGVRNALTGSTPLRGITLDPTTNDTTAYYGHFDGPSTRLRITVRK